jgi:hypothetical protein
MTRDTIIDRGRGGSVPFVIRKVVTIDLDKHVETGKPTYFVDFEGLDPIPYEFLKQARERAKEPPPVSNNPELHLATGLAGVSGSPAEVDG